MKIVIAGAGGVGSHLANLLSREKHDIVLIDPDESKLEAPGSRLDLLTYNASATSIQTLKDAGAGTADLVIAVTTDASRNLTICMLSHTLGAKKTVARIDNAEYLNSRYQSYFKGMGIDSLIYPERLVAQEIADSMKMSWVRQSWEFHDGALELIGVKVRQNALILNQKLKDLGTNDLPFHVVAIKRRGRTLIPKGNDMILAGDLVYFMTMQKNLTQIHDLCGKEGYEEIKNITIIGGGEVAVQAAEIIPDHMAVKIIEIDEERAKQLTALVNDRIMVIHGDGRDMSLLVEEDIKKTQAFVALTGNAETNILACLAAKRMGVRKTVAMVSNFDYVDMAESLDIGTIINKKTVAAGHIYQMMLDADVYNLKRLTVSSADVVEFIAGPKARATNKEIHDLDLPEGATIGGLVRNGEGILASGSTRIEEGDSVVVFCVDMDVKKLERFFN